MSEEKESGLRDKMVVELLISVMGTGHYTARNNVAFICPFCHHPKPKLEIQIKTNEKKENPWHCWVCGEKGKTLSLLFNKIKPPQHKINELNLLIIPGSKIKKQDKTIQLNLPKEYIPLSSHTSLKGIDLIEAKHALNFLRSRNVKEEDIFKYKIGFCIDGCYSHRIVVPSFDENGELNFFSTRTYLSDDPQHYINPDVSRNIIGWDYYINWNVPIILVEGIFDALTVKRNVIPLFGKEISEELMKKIVGSQVKKVYIALDADALREALKNCEKLMSYGIEVYLVELEGKDPSAMGFEKFLTTLENTLPLTFEKILRLKMKM